ncbi:putative disease resistance protein [Salvia divinorum]|uniref:Disease resistance protein n=1 Tax=Salvia divinorum TaxID=28513 RepID=A0ABD1HXU1_SALDI
MAYNLQTLITILEGILDPDQTRWIVDENNPQLQSLLDKATSLQQLLDKSSLTKLDSQIREVAHQTEEILESHMVDHMLSGSDCVIFTFSTPDLQQVILDLDSLMEQAEKLVEMDDDKMLPELDSAMEQLKLVEMPSISSSSSKSAVVVGIDEDLTQLKDRLTSMEKKLEIVPIVELTQPTSLLHENRRRCLLISRVAAPLPLSRKTPGAVTVVARDVSPLPSPAGRPMLLRNSPQRLPVPVGIVRTDDSLSLRFNLLDDGDYKG